MSPNEVTKTFQDVIVLSILVILHSWDKPIKFYH